MQQVPIKRIKIYQVDAFTDRLFAGNPAAVCFLQEWISDETMQQIAAENNLAETAFVVPMDLYFEIRWFTPAVEVDLCGHATLATAFVLYQCLGYNAPAIVFQSPRSGELKVLNEKNLLWLDFPADVLVPSGDSAIIRDCIGVEPIEVFKGKTDYIAVLGCEADVLHLKPDMIKTAALNARGLVVTAPGNEVDFVSRFFAPQSGIDEDPVTGSAHTSLIPLWFEKFGKSEMQARQLSKRGGNLLCIHNGARCLIGGDARLYLEGELVLP
jgi:PhzF family phenazine biosynthesis protein